MWSRRSNDFVLKRIARWARVAVDAWLDRVAQGIPVMGTPLVRELGGHSGGTDGCRRADDRVMDGQPALVGRESEQAALQAAVEGAVGGEPGLVLIHGEAGIGKTSLVREAADAARVGGCHVLLGQCLRFGANVTSYVPFTQGITQWLRTTGSNSRDRLAPHGRLSDLVPAIAHPVDGIVLLQIGAFLDALQQDKPTVLVLDDLQWSDPSSLDAISYLVAGFAGGQRLAILATYRDTDLGEGIGCTVGWRTCFGCRR